MAETVVNGAFLGADGKTWHDCEGRPLEGGALHEAKASLAEQAAIKAETQRVWLVAEHAQNPVAAALAAALAPKPAKVEAEPVKVGKPA